MKAYFLSRSEADGAAGLQHGQPYTHEQIEGLIGKVALLENTYSGPVNKGKVIASRILPREVPAQIKPAREKGGKKS